MPGNLAECLTSNAIVTTFLDQLRSSDSATDEQCYDCAREAAPFECLACCKFMCPDCEEAHRKNFARHKVLRGKKNCQRNVCAEHNQPSDLFCMQEKTYCCRDCTSSHRSHEVLTIDEARRSLVGTVYRYRDLNKEVLRNLTEMQAVIVKKLDQVTKTEKESLVEIEKTYEGIKGLVFEAKSFATQRISKHFRAPCQDIVGKLTTIRSIHTKLKEYQELEDDLVFYSRAPELAEVRIQQLALPVSISLEFPQMQVVCSLLEHSYVIDKMELESAAVSQLLYLSRGSRDYIVYNFETDRTDVKQIYTEDLIIHRWCGFAVLPDQSVIVTGGKESKDSGAKDLVFMFYPESGQTTQLPSMLNGHSSHVCLYVDLQVYVLGGKNQNNSTYSECEVYSIRNLHWRPIAPMILSRTCASGVHNAGKLYVFGGYQTQVDDSIEVYSIVANSWQLLPVHLPDKVWQHASVPIGEGQVLIFGGECGNDEPNTRSYILTLETMTFHGFTQMPIQSNWLFFWLHVALRGNALYAMSKEMQILKFSIASNEWSNYK